MRPISYEASNDRSHRNSGMLVQGAMTCNDAAQAKSDQRHVPVHCKTPFERRGFSFGST